MTTGKARVRALRSVEIAMTDRAQALKFFTDAWHLTPVTEAKGVHYLRGSGAFHHILSIRQAPRTALIRVVFDAADRAAVDAIHAQAVAHGLAAIDAPRPLKQPFGDYGFGYKDPEDRNIAVICGTRDHADTADSPDRPRKISHINLNNSDPDATFACFRDVLGFALSDTTKKMRFISCGSDHHSVVLGFGGGTTLNHIAFEMPDLDAVMRGAGRMRDNGRGIEWGPGRHGPGNNVFCYFLGPENLPIEYTGEMQQIDASYLAGEPDDWKWPPGRLDHWGITAKTSECMEVAGQNYLFTEDGWRLDEWR
ncbi:MAG: VOC family protein [Pseudolabrys sp.]|nr:VOC family protein [Pseudolabrys sp.]MDP2297341.1 VOC family protein [Pseudolabrys sp.]